MSKAHCYDVITIYPLCPLRYLSVNRVWRNNRKRVLTLFSGSFVRSKREIYKINIVELLMTCLTYSWF